MIKPRPRHIVVFAIRGKKKVGTLYSPLKGHYADYHEIQPVWFAGFGDGCRILAEGAAIGRKGYVMDTFELEAVPASAWKANRDLLPQIVIDEILAEATLHDGTITANIVHENSVIGLEEEPWTPSPSTPPSLVLTPP